MTDHRDPRDPLRDGEPLREREHVRERETTVVHTDTGRRGGGGWLIAIVLLLALLALLYFLFGNQMNRAADEVGVNVNVEAPDMPDIKVPDVEASLPDVKVPDAPDIDVKTDGDGNRQ
jgi:hypothetical protein